MLRRAKGGGVERMSSERRYRSSDDDDRFGGIEDGIEFDLMYERGAIHTSGHST